MTRLLLLLAMWLPLGTALAETTPRDLLAAGHLQIDASIAPDTGIVPGQKLRLTLKIATDTWFTGGTRIEVPEVPGLVILQNEQFAANASENRGGTTWVVQRWSLDVFPQRGGDFSIPGVTLRVKVNGGDAGNVEGELQGPPVSFTATVPESLAEVEHWVAAPTFSARQSFDRELTGLAVGDAIERQIVLEATDIMAMMLPAYTPGALEGLAAYPEPPQLDNSINRGEYRASRRMTISYVAQAPGDYLLPAVEFFWWDTRTEELQLVSLPETRLTVTGTAAKVEESPLDRQTLVSGALILGAVVIALLLARVLYRYFPAGRVAGLYRESRLRLREMRKPALPRNLNPGSSAGD